MKSIVSFFCIFCFVLNTSSQNNEASIVSITHNEQANNYRFSVGISSPDTGCSQYANWWEVISEDGTLLYRRILAHSHVNEQPFVRSGRGIHISATQTVIIRAHMNNSGYGTKAYKGSISSGFKEVIIDKDFALELEKQLPLPKPCTS